MNYEPVFKWCIYESVPLWDVFSIAMFFLMVHY